VAPCPDGEPVLTARQSFRSGRWRRGRVPTGANPEEAAKVAIARRAKPGAPPDHVRLVLTLELRRALAEHLSVEAIRSDDHDECCHHEQRDEGSEQDSGAMIAPADKVEWKATP